MIAIQRPTRLFVGGLRDFIVWIVGHRTGRVKRGVPGEFTVDPGEHTVVVSMDWVGSPPLRIVVEPGSRTGLVIGARRLGVALKPLLPIVLAILVTGALIEVLRQTTSLAEESGLLRAAVILVVYAVVFAGYLLVTRRFCGEYWAMFTLSASGAATSSRA